MQKKSRLATKNYTSFRLGSTSPVGGFSNVTRPLLISGWSNPEPWGVWSEEAQARIGFKIDEKVDSDVVISLMLKGFLTPAKNTLTAVPVVNGRTLSQIVIRGDQTNPTQHTIRVSRQDLADANGRIELDFDIRDPRSPKEMGLSEDARKLGLGLVSVSVHRAAPPDL